MKINLTITHEELVDAVDDWLKNKNVCPDEHTVQDVVELATGEYEIIWKDKEKVPLVIES